MYLLMKNLCCALLSAHFCLKYIVNNITHCNISIRVNNGYKVYDAKINYL